MGFFALWRVRIFGLRNVPNSGGVLLACNHQSFLDPVLVTLALYREGNFMARDTLFVNRHFRRLIESLNAFPVKRNTADVGAIKEIMRRLKDGRVVVTFPEGTRTEDGTIGELLEGSLMVAKRTGATIVPTVIDGAFEAWPKGLKLPRPGRVSVSYGEPLGPGAMAGLSVEELARQTRERLLGLQRAMQRKSLVGR